MRTTTTPAAAASHGMIAAAAVLLGVASSVTAASLPPPSQFDVTNIDQIKAVAKQAMTHLNANFSANMDTNEVGSWYMGSVQYHESAMFYTIYLDYYRNTGDGSFNSFFQPNIYEAAYESSDDFLNEEARGLQALEGKWNDDLGWWGIVGATGASIYGTKAVICPDCKDSGTWFNAANKTLSEMLESQQYDKSICQGGIFWQRDHQDYKSLITNIEAIWLSAHLLQLMPTEMLYKKTCDDLYNWMLTAKFPVEGMTDTFPLIAPDYSMADGVRVISPSDPTKCAINDTNYYSYSPGMLMGAMSVLYNATGDISYLQEAEKIFNRQIDYFTSNDTFSLVEPSCYEFIGRCQYCYGSRSCKTPAAYMWPMLRGLSDLWRTTQDVTIKNKITSLVQNSTKQMLITQQCDDTYQCVRVLPNQVDKNGNQVQHQYTLNGGINVRDQFEACYYLNALLVVAGQEAIPVQQNVSINTAISAQVSATGTSVPQASQTTTPKSSGLVVPAFSWAQLVAFALAALALAL